MALSNVLYRLSRLLRDAEALGSGDPRRVATLAKNRAVGPGTHAVLMRKARGQPNPENDERGEDNRWTSPQWACTRRVSSTEDDGRPGSSPPLWSFAGLAYVFAVMDMTPSPRKSLTEACLSLVEVPPEFSETPHPESEAAIEAFSADPVCGVLVER